jgi:hypothetical protein
MEAETAARWGAETLNSRAASRQERSRPHRLHLKGRICSDWCLRESAIQREFSLPNLNLTFEHQNVPLNCPNDTLCLFRITRKPCRTSSHSRTSRVN